MQTFIGIGLLLAFIVLVIYLIRRGRRDTSTNTTQGVPPPAGTRSGKTQNEI